MLRANTDTVLPRDGDGDGRTRPRTWRWWLWNVVVAALSVAVAPLGAVLAWTLTRWPVWVKILVTAWAVLYLFFTLFSPPSRDRTPGAPRGASGWTQLQGT